MLAMRGLQKKDKFEQSYSISSWRKEAILLSSLTFVRKVLQEKEWAHSNSSWKKETFQLQYLWYKLFFKTHLDKAHWIRSWIDILQEIANVFNYYRVFKNESSMRKILYSISNWLLYI